MGGRVVSLSPTACLSKRSMATTRTHRQGRAVGAALLLTALSSLAGMVPVGRSTPAGGVTAAAAATPPHIMVIVDENKGYSAAQGSPFIIGNTSSAPYINNTLATTFTSATHWFSNQHGSVPDYEGLIAGSNQAGAGPTVVDELASAGISWKAYMEGMPTPCYRGNPIGNYDPNHNPFIDFTSITNNTSQCNNVVPYSPNAMTDLNSASPPDFVFVSPDSCDDMHTNGGPCPQDPVTAGDTWLATNIPAIMSTAWYAQNGIIILTWDESNGADGSGWNGTTGGHVATLIISAANQAGSRTYTAGGNLFGILRGIETDYGVGYLGASTDVANGDISTAFGAQAAPGSISGAVTDAGTQAAIANATVSGGGGSTTTDSNGNYSIVNLSPSTYTVTAAANGYVSLGHSVTVRTGAMSPQNFALTPQPPPPFHPTGVGQPAVTVGSDGTQLLFWQGAGNHLIEAWWNGSWNGPVDWTAANGWAATVTSAPSVVIQANGTQLIFWQGPGGHLFEAWYAGGWNGPVDWTAANHWAASVTSAPSVALAPDGTTQLIFWQGAGSHLMEAWWNGSWNGPVDWTAANHWAASVASSPSVTFSGTTQLIFWKGTTGHLLEAWWNGSWNGPVDWTAANSWGSPLTSAPTAVVQSGGTQLIFWQGAGGHLIEAWWNGSWNGPVDWTAANGWGSPLTSAPSVALSGSTQVIFWQGTGGHLIEAWWNGSWNGPADWSA
jgi:hypothetical protein